MFKKHLNWETAQYLVLFLTVAGQVLIGVNYYWGQGAWLIANAITVTRNVKLERPKADKVQGWFMFALTCGKHHRRTLGSTRKGVGIFL